MIQYRRDLWKLVKDVHGDLCEVGIAEGNFSRDILDWPLIDAPRLYMVDRWMCSPDQKGDGSQPQAWHDANLSAAKNRVAHFGERAVILRGDSVAMAANVPNGSLAFLYVDCDHSYEGVKRDLIAWVPKVVRGGVVALHDYENEGYGVKRAVSDYCRRKHEVFTLPENNPEDAGAYFLC